MSSNNRPKLAVDAMGGDFGPSVVVPGALQAARNTGAKVILVGIEEEIRKTIADLSAQSEEGELFEIVNATQLVETEENPNIFGFSDHPQESADLAARDPSAS